MQILISILLGVLIVICFLVVNHITYKRESMLLEINWKYKALLKELTRELDEARDCIDVLEEENEGYNKAIYDFIDNFNATYSNTRLSFDEANCAFVIEDIDVDDSLPTEEEIMQENEKEDENK